LLYVDSNLESSEVSFDSLFKEFVILKIKGANSVHLTVCNVYRRPSDIDWEIFTTPKNNLSSQLFIKVLRDKWTNG